MECPRPKTLEFGPKPQVVRCNSRDCLSCQEAKIRQWTQRIELEARYHPHSTFFTGTYADELVPLTPAGVPTNSKSQVQKFLKRFRINLDRCSEPVKVRHLVISEYSPSGRPHIHGLLLGVRSFEYGLGFEHPHYTALKKAWEFGHLDALELNNENVHYVVSGHVLGGGVTPAELCDREAPFVLRSIGLGRPAVPMLAQMNAKAMPHLDGTGPWLDLSGDWVLDRPPAQAPDLLPVIRKNGRVNGLAPYLRTKIRAELGLPELVRDGRSRRWSPPSTPESREAALGRERRYREKLRRRGKHKLY